MAATIPGGLYVNGRFPLDDKYWVNNLSEIDNGLTYIGQIRFTKDTEQVYIKRTPGWALLVNPSSGGSGGIGIGKLLNYAIDTPGEQTITLPSTPSEIILVTVIVGGTRIGVVTDYEIVKSKLHIKSEARLAPGDVINCIYATGSGGTGGGDNGDTNATIIDIISRLDDLTARVNGIGSGGGDSDWIPTTKWLDTVVIDESNYTKYCDNILFRRIAANQYEKRKLIGNAIDMNLYLFNDGRDNIANWKKFDDYIGQQNTTNPFFLTLIFSDGTYYFSKPLRIENRRYTFTGNGTVRFAAGAGFRNIGRSGDFYRYLDLRIDFAGKVQGEGYIQFQKSPTIRQFINVNNIPLYIKNGEGITLDDLLNNPAYIDKYTPSFNPADYTSWAIYTNTVTLIEGCIISGQTAGIYMDGAGIGVDPNNPNPDYPDGRNTSMSIVRDTTVRRGRGPDLVCFGADGNHIRVEDCDFRDGESVGLMDLSQSGAQGRGIHEAIHFWGGLWMLSNGAWTLAAIYSEINSTTYNIFAGEGTFTGGPLNSQTAVTSGNVCVQRGSNFSNLRANIAIQDTLSFLGKDRYSQFTLSHDSSLTAWTLDFGGSPDNRGIFAFHPFYGGKPAGIDTRSINNNGMLNYAIDANISRIQSDIRAYWKLGDMVHVANYWDRHGPREYVCLYGGFTGGLNYNDIEDLTVTQYGGNQGLLMSGISGLLSAGMTITVNGVALYIVNTGIVNDKTLLSVDFPGINLAGQSGIITLSTARFKAQGWGSGATNQRPTYLTSDDDGWQYKDTDLKKMIQWDGDSLSWKDFMGNAV